jgi:hypothetical protein
MLGVIGLVQEYDTAKWLNQTAQNPLKIQH